MGLGRHWNLDESTAVRQRQLARNLRVLGDMADERSSRNTRTVDDFRDLPEPARAQAVNFFHEIVQRGEDPGNADHQARELAEKWIRERAPG